MRLTQRDILLFEWINGHGFVKADQIMRFLKVKKTTGYRRIKKLVDNGYIERKNILHGAGAVHLITKKAQNASGDDLGILKNISLGGFVHDLRLVDLSLDLQEKYNGDFISERRLRFWGGLGGVGIEGHIPDGVLEFSDKKKWAVELEMSVKAASRLKNIMNGYAGNFDYEEVYYFVSKKVIENAVQKAVSASGAAHIKIELLKEDHG